MGINHVEACSIGYELCSCFYSTTLEMSCVSNIQDIQNESSNILDLDGLRITTINTTNILIELTIQNKVYSSINNFSINNRLAGQILNFTLTKNRIDIIQAYAFSGLLRAARIYLNNNGIEEIEAYALNGLVNLQYLKVNSNKLKLIKYGTFNALPQLIGLSFI